GGLSPYISVGWSYVTVRECAGCTLYARRAYRLCKARPRLLRSMDGGGGVREAAAAALEAKQRLRDLGHGQGRLAVVENERGGGVADCHAVMRSIHQPRRQRRDHVETRFEVAHAADLRNVGIEIRHADERAVAERRERVKHVVGRERTSHAVKE